VAAAVADIVIWLAVLLITAGHTEHHHAAPDWRGPARSHMPGAPP
jgi:hypothetical protein